MTHCPVFLLQDSSLQFTGHNKSHVGPQYPSTHPWIQNPNASQTWLMQFLLHPSFEINIYINIVVGREIHIHTENLKYGNENYLPT